jgi:hypothetical protein
MSKFVEAGLAKFNIRRQTTATELEFDRVIGLTILGLAILLGFWVRYTAVAGSDFPLNDGGLFYQMVVDLVQNQFRLPVYTQYNQALLPYVYPAFGFYIVGFLHAFFDLELFWLFRFVPLFFSTATILAVYFLARQIWDRILPAALTAFTFAMLYRGFKWFVMGGGVTRAPALFFSVFALGALLRYIKHRSVRWLVVYCLLSALTLMTHPETILFLALSSGILYLKFGNLRLLPKDAVLFGAGILAASSPWWLQVILNDNLNALLTAAPSGYQHWSMLAPLMSFYYTEENSAFLTIIGVLSLLGMFWMANRRDFWLPLWIVLVYLLLPRSGVGFVTVPVSFSAIYALDRLLQLEQMGKQSQKTGAQTSQGVKQFLLGAFLLYNFLSVYTFIYLDELTSNRLTDVDLEAMLFVEEKMDPGASYLVLPQVNSDGTWVNDYWGEWFPALTGRPNVIIVQGSEWLPGGFIRYVEQYAVLRSCIREGVNCIPDWQEDYQVEFTHLYVPKSIDRLVFLELLKREPAYTLVYDGEGAAIFAVENLEATP